MDIKYDLRQEATIGTRRSFLPLMSMFSETLYQGEFIAGWACMFPEGGDGGQPIRSCARWLKN